MKQFFNIEIIRFLFFQLTFLVVFYSCVFSQSSNAVIIKNNNEYYNLSKKVEIFNDSTNKLSIIQIVEKCDSLPFRINQNDDVHFDFSQNNHWIRFHLFNVTKVPKHLILEIKNPTINILQVFEVHHNSIWRTEETGDSHEFKTRSYSNRNFLYEISILPHDEYTYYIKINGEGDALNIPISIFSHSVYGHRANIEQLLYGIFYGIIIASLLTTLIFVFNFRNRANFYYVFYVFFIGLFNFYFDGLAFQYLWPNMPVFNNKLVIILPLLILACLILFGTEYLNIGKNYPVIKKTNKVMFLIISVIGIISFFNVNFKIIALSTYSLAFIVLLYIIISAFLCLKYEKRLAIHFLVAFLGLIIATAVLSSNILGGILHAQIRDYSLKIGVSFQVIFLTVALSIRLRLLLEESHEKTLEHLQQINILKENQNIELEKKVNDRTLQLTNANSKLMAAFGNIKLVNIELANKNSEVRAQCDEIESQVELVTKQKEILEAQKNEILDSILYAKYLQNSVFPPKGLITKIIPNHFIFYKPKAIVSGDFYWMKVLEKKPNDNSTQIDNTDIYIAAVDCTGHGVPGAFLSIIASNELHKSVEINNKPSEILRNLSRSVFETLNHKHSIEFIKDGMSIALCCFNFEKMLLQFAGAYHPLYIIRHNQLTEYAGDRISIGAEYSENLVFTNYEIPLVKDDMIYIFSDGYIDQFGGGNDKKYQARFFKQLLLDIHKEPAQKQNELLDQHLKNWMGDNEQIDDILIIGIKV